MMSRLKRFLNHSHSSQGRVSRHRVDTKVLRRPPGQTDREKFLAGMEAVVPWDALIALIEPHYPRSTKEALESSAHRQDNAL
jgi:hypothetical protein